MEGRTFQGAMRAEDRHDVILQLDAPLPTLAVDAQHRSSICCPSDSETPLTTSSNDVSIEPATNLAVSRFTFFMAFYVM